jgi:NhaP-type Na+/H+ or K+/H+ antiporter
LDLKSDIYLVYLFIAIAILCGIIFGPLCANFINVANWGNQAQITKEYSRIVIAIQVMAAGVALPKAYLWREAKSLLILLGPVMIWMWLISGLLVWALIPGLNFVSN